MPLIMCRCSDWRMAKPSRCSMAKAANTLPRSPPSRKSACKRKSRLFRRARMSFPTRSLWRRPCLKTRKWIGSSRKPSNWACLSSQPLAAQRCVVRLSDERAAKRMVHWQGIVIAASEQSGRNRLAQIAQPADFREWITQHDLHQRILLTPRAEQSLSDWARHHPPQAMTLMIGPEGGFTDAEESLAQTHGILPLAMGARVLRTETAGLAAIAAINAVWGQL